MAGCLKCMNTTPQTITSNNLQKFFVHFEETTPAFRAQSERLTEMQEEQKHDNVQCSAALSWRSRNLGSGAVFVWMDFCPILL